MPIRQNILRKGKAPKQNLLEFDTLAQESGVLGDLTTSRFFKISEFPSVLPSGNSSFLIEGSDLLKPEIELKTELLDSQGNPIFHYAIPNYDKELPSRRIAIEVYEDEVVNGVGSFTVFGEINPEKFDVPVEFRDTYNVRFTAPITINKKIKNTQPIRFYGDPTLSVSELVKGVLERVPTGGSTQTTITGSVEFINPNPQVEFSVDSGSLTGNSNQFEEVGNSLKNYINQNQGSAQSSILQKPIRTKKPYTFVVKEMEKGVDNALNKITSAMKGASFSITRPDLLVDSTTYPDSKFNKPQSFETKILDVINSTTFTTTTEYTIINKKNNNKIVVPLSPSSSNATITHNVVSSTESENEVFQRSFANMTVGNLRTFSGDTYKAKIYMKEEGTSGEFEKIYETLVEAPNELVDLNSITGFKNVGLFNTQSIVDNYWITSSNTAQANTNDDTLIDGVLLSGSVAGVSDNFTFITSQSLSLEKNEDYVVEFNTAFKPSVKTQSDGTTKPEAVLEVFLTGSFLSENQTETSLGEVDLSDEPVNTNVFKIVNEKQITDFKTHNGNSSPSGSLGFRVKSGQFILQDVRLRPFSETNFSPGFFKANVPMPKPVKRGKPYDFMVEFFDANNNLAETVALQDNVSFNGPRQVIGDGDDAILTGSVFLSNTEDSGIEFHGGSAYIRSVGYNGFDRTIAESKGGFMMFSGSVSKSLNTSESYDGVGLELVDAHGENPSGSRFLRFRTSGSTGPSQFEVQTDTFLFGIKGTNNNYISGSNGNLEISSSNFALQEDGDVILEGSITAEVGGTIGGFSIGDSSLSAGNVFQLSSSQNTADPVSFISSSRFKVSAGGQLTASSVQITGEVNADTGTVATSLSNIGVSTSSINTQTGSFITNFGVLGDTTASIHAQTSSLLTSASLAADSASAATASINVLNVSSQSMETQVRLSDSGVDIQNKDGATISRFSTSAKFFGSASLSNTYAEVSEDGLTIVSGSVTQSFFGDDVILGTTSSEHIKISGSGLEVKSGSVSKIQIHDQGVQIGSSGGGISFDLDGNMTFGSSLQSDISGSGAYPADSASQDQTLLESSQSMATQVKISSTGVDVQNEQGGTISRFSTSAKFFGSASLSNTYAEVSEDGLTIVSGSATSSFFGNEVLLGDTSGEHIKIDSDSIDIKTSNNVTVLSASADGIVMSGSVTANEGTIGGFTLGPTSLIAGSGTTRVSLDTSAGIHLGDNTFSSAPFRVTRAGALTATSVAITGEVNATSGTTLGSINALGVQTASILIQTGSLLTFTGSAETSFVAIGTATASLNEQSASFLAHSASMNQHSASVNAETGSINSSLGDIGTATASLNEQSASFLAHSASMNLHTSSINTRTGSLDDLETQVVISSDGMDLLNANTNELVSSFRTNIHLNRGNVVIGTTGSNEENVLIDSDSVDIRSGTSALASFGSTTTIGNTSGQHISIDSDSLDIKTAANVTALSASSAGIVMSGSITATQGNIGGFKINNQELSASGLTISATDQKILITGSNAITDGNTVFLDGAGGVIQVSQSGVGIFDSGRTATFTKETVVDPAVFKQGSLQVQEIVSSSTEITNPVTTAENLRVISSSKMNRLETQQVYMDTDSTTSGQGSLTPFFYVDKGLGRYANAGINSASSVVFSSQKNLTAQEHTNRSLPPEFVFSAEYFTVPIETTGEFGFVNNSENSGSSIFTITTKVSGSNHTSATGDTDDFTDAKFNILALEADTRGLPNARKSEFTFLQAKASSSIMFQLQHDGDVVSRGNLTAFGTSFLTVSDEREKKHIYQISESLDKVLDLRPTKFTWKETDKEDVGFIAQEVEQVIPEVVETTKGFIDVDSENQSEERKTIAYPKLIPYLVDTIQHLTKRIEELEKKVK